MWVFLSGISAVVHRDLNRLYVLSGVFYRPCNFKRIKRKEYFRNALFCCYVFLPKACTDLLGDLLNVRGELCASERALFTSVTTLPSSSVGWELAYPSLSRAVFHLFSLSLALWRGKRKANKDSLKKKKKKVLTSSISKTSVGKDRVYALFRAGKLLFQKLKLKGPRFLKGIHMISHLSKAQWHGYTNHQKLGKQ